MTLPAVVMLVASSLAAADGGVDLGRIPVDIQVHDGLATGDAFQVYGRVLKTGGHVPDENLARIVPPPSFAEQPLRMLSAFDTDEAKNARVLVTVLGSTYSALTDDDGNFDLKVRGAAARLETGTHPIRVDVGTDRFVRVRGGQGLLYVFPSTGVAIVSDIDDTVVQTHVTDKARLVREALTRRPEALTPVPGAAQAYERALQAGAAGVVFVSGSPQNLQPRLLAFLQHHGIPRGPMLLKNVGADDLFAQDEYKLRRIESLLVLFPGLRFVLVGDDGERDPEIYAELRRRHPSRRFSVVIRHAPGARPSPERLTGMRVVDDYSADPDVLAREVKALKR